MGKKLAIDIVLLFSEETNRILCDLSDKLITPLGEKPYILDNTNYIPHISLLMGTAYIEDIEKIEEKVKKVFQKYFPLKITFISKIDSKFPGLMTKKTKELVDLQKEIADIITLDYDATRDMFVDPEISDKGIEWVNKYKENNLSNGKFNIHATIGYGDASNVDIEFPFEVTINTSAICHLGYGCSCRKILFKNTKANN